MSKISDWQPTSSIINLLQRAKIINEIRRFFSDRCILEVETPAISQFTVTDVHLSPFKTYLKKQGSKNENINMYLISSPEYHMKRLLAAGSGPIYQLCHSFRNKEIGRYHNPEFTILEWYRPHFDIYHLINEVDDFLQQILECSNTELLSYQQAFLRYLNIDPFSSEKNKLYEVAKSLNLENFIKQEEDKDVLLQLLFTVGIEPYIGKEKPTTIYHFPATQASLAKISQEDHRVSERFEVYYKGMELANGFHELTDVIEQRRRFELDNNKRSALGLQVRKIDEYFLSALASGLPDCSGVAIGIDRLIMIALKAEKITDVITFPITIA
ncbi:Elongation factor P--(R)-beta-lysine ligase [Candidatus Providencia siddallii]|uniref:Elongation factor P--(R)-beta-lysine ligase n=1 Tax=Candidatus Providencia siddallii TaxID=1715285 RepID=A0A0M6W6M1_9GAMM|nr:Elongation factor P--(R)-beta-lysine ligase [Candidatus Providencia siddallii]